MNLRNVLRAYGLLRSLSDDESALLNILRALNDNDREQLVATMSDKPQKKSSERVIDHCAVCDYTKRALLHKDPNVGDYHEFQSSASSSKKATGGGGRSKSRCSTCGEVEIIPIHNRSHPAYHKFEPSPKSARASGMTKTLSDNLSQRRQGRIPNVVEHDTEEPARCQFTRADGNLCKLLPDHNIHHLTTAREYHEFQSLPSPRCAFRVTDIERCSATEDDPIHDAGTSFDAYHEFVAPPTTGKSDAQSAAGGS